MNHEFETSLNQERETGLATGLLLKKKVRISRNLFKASDSIIFCIFYSSKIKQMGIAYL